MQEEPTPVMLSALQMFMFKENVCHRSTSREEGASRQTREKLDVYSNSENLALRWIHRFRALPEKKKSRSNAVRMRFRARSGFVHKVQNFEMQPPAFWGGSKGEMCSARVRLQDVRALGFRLGSLWLAFAGRALGALAFAGRALGALATVGLGSRVQEAFGVWDALGGHFNAAIFVAEVCRPLVSGQRVTSRNATRIHL